jgi:hypothetical protein
MQEELRAKEIDSEERIQYVLMAFAELIANLPPHESMQTNEEIDKFLLDCIKLNRPGFYLDMIAHYCKNTTTNIEKLAGSYLDSSLMHINSSDQAMV